MAADVVYVVDNGLAITTDRLLGTPTMGSPHWVHWGIGVTPAAAADTVLESPGAEARTVGTDTVVTTTTYVVKFRPFSRVRMLTQDRWLWEPVTFVLEEV